MCRAVQLEDWEGFDLFRVARLTDGRPLQTVGLNLLRKRGLIGKLGLAEDKLSSFLQVGRRRRAGTRRLGIARWRQGTCRVEQFGGPHDPPRVLLSSRFGSSAEKAHHLGGCQIART